MFGIIARSGKLLLFPRIILIHVHKIQSLFLKELNWLVPFYGARSSLCQDTEQGFSLSVFDDSLWNFLVEWTNKYAANFLSGVIIKPCSLYRNWVPVTLDEIKAFIGVIFIMGLAQPKSLKDYWSTYDLREVPFFHACFRCHRFLSAGEIRSSHWYSDSVLSACIQTIKEGSHRRVCYQFYRESRP